MAFGIGISCDGEVGLFCIWREDIFFEVRCHVQAPSKIVLREYSVGNFINSRIFGVEDY